MFLVGVFVCLSCLSVSLVCVCVGDWRAGFIMILLSFVSAPLVVLRGETTEQQKKLAYAENNSRIWARVLEMMVKITTPAFALGHRQAEKEEGRSLGFGILAVGRRIGANSLGRFGVFVFSFLFSLFAAHEPATWSVPLVFFSDP